MRVIANIDEAKDSRPSEALRHSLAEDAGKIVVVHKQPLVADALATCLPIFGDLKVLAHGHSGAEAIGLARAHQPRVMLLDESVDDAPTKIVLASIALHSYYTSIVLLRTAAVVSSRWESPLVVGEHLQRDGLESLVTLVQLVLAERRPNRSTLARELPSSQLITSRERSVLSLVALGKSNGEVARELYISASTVKRHLANIYAKLEVHSRVGAVRQAQRLGIVEFD